MAKFPEFSTELVCVGQLQRPHSKKRAQRKTSALFDLYLRTNQEGRDRLGSYGASNQHFRAFIQKSNMIEPAGGLLFLSIPTTFFVAANVFCGSLAFVFFILALALKIKFKWRKPESTPILVDDGVRFY